MAVEKAIASSSLAEVVDRILDKSEVVAGVDTFVKHAEAVGLTASAQKAY